MIVRVVEVWLLASLPASLIIGRYLKGLRDD